MLNDWYGDHLRTKYLVGGFLANSSKHYVGRTLTLDQSIINLAQKVSSIFSPKFVDLFVSRVEN